MQTFFPVVRFCIVQRSLGTQRIRFERTYPVVTLEVVPFRNKTRWRRLPDHVIPPPLSIQNRAKPPGILSMVDVFNCPYVFRPYEATGCRKVLDKIADNKPPKWVFPLPMPAKTGFISCALVRIYSCGAESLNLASPIIRHFLCCQKNNYFCTFGK